MEPAHGGAASEQGAEPVEARVEQRQAAKEEQYERGRYYPMVDAGPARITAHTNVCAVIVFALSVHVLPPASRSAFSSSSFETRLGPCSMWWSRPATAVRPMTAMPAYLPTPFQASTSGLIRGLSGSPL